jgi:DNA helicase-2/ATP-dependent DNA helicase PcrA
MQIPLYQALSRLEEMPELKPAISKLILEFFQALEFYRNQLNRLNAYQISEAIINDFELRSIYEKTDQIEDENRLENINELLNSIKIFIEQQPEQDDLGSYLEVISLLTDIDQWDPDRPSVTLMTLHSVKGLEFPVVIITGLEDGLLPLSRNQDKEEELEEERRLFYVGMTRAKERLYLIHARSRHRFGKEDYGSVFRNFPSRFLKEIPAEFTQVFLESPKSSSSRQPSLFYPQETSGRTYMENLPDENSEFKIGQLVHHEVFGNGQVLGVETSTLGTKLIIQFENLSIKKLIAQYANLTLLENRE